MATIVVSIRIFGSQANSLIIVRNGAIKISFVLFGQPATDKEAGEIRIDFNTLVVVCEGLSKGTLRSVNRAPN